MEEPMTTHGLKTTLISVVIGSFTLLVDMTPSAAQAAPHVITVGNLNNIGNPDLVGRAGGNGDIVFYPNIGAQRQVAWGTPSVIIRGADLRHISIGDLNNGGLNDLVARASNGDILFYPNTGGAGEITWETPQLVARGTGFWAASPATPTSSGTTAWPASRAWSCWSRRNWWRRVSGSDAGAVNVSRQERSIRRPRAPPVAAAAARPQEGVALALRRHPGLLWKTAIGPLASRLRSKAGSRGCCSASGSSGP